MNGIVFGLLYGIPSASPRWKRTIGGNIGMGLLYSVIMSIISAGPLLPHAYVPNQGYGLFLFDGPDGRKLSFATLAWYLIYGFFLGALYQPTEVDIAVSSLAKDSVYYEESGDHTPFKLSPRLTPTQLI